MKKETIGQETAELEQGHVEILEKSIKYFTGV